MTEITRHLPGTFCWVELSTTDTASARKFYEELFGWRRSFVLRNGSFYTLMRFEGKDVSALNELRERQMPPGAAPQWLLYVAVENVDRSVAQAAALGGRLLVAAFEVMDVGRMAIVQDPTGATFALWQAREHIGAQLMNHSGALSWQELATDDASTAGDFYKGLFGWDVQPSPRGKKNYAVFSKDGQRPGGLTQMKRAQDVPHWTAYFAVDNCDLTALKAQALGAVVKLPPTDVAEVGRCAVIQDRQGAVFSIIEMKPTRTVTVAKSASAQPLSRVRPQPVFAHSLAA